MKTLKLFTRTGVYEYMIPHGANVKVCFSEPPKVKAVPRKSSLSEAYLELELSPSKVTR